MAALANAMWYGEHDIDEYLTFAITTSQFSSGAGTDATGSPAYAIYEDETAAEVVSGTLAKLDDGGTIGFYTERVQLTDANFDVGKMYTIYITATVDSVAGTATHAFKMRAAPIAVASVQLSATAAANLEDTYDGTGYADDVAPATQLQISTLAGGIAVSTTATGITISEPGGGEQTLTYAATATHDGVYHEVASDDVGDDIDFYYTFNTGDGMNLPVAFHFHGYYEDNNAPANSTMVIQSYNFNIADWDTIATLTDSAVDIDLNLPLHVHDVDSDGGGAGDVRIRFNLTTPEVSQNVRIDHATVLYVTGGLTASAVVDEWKTQSQADPTDFHVNLLEVEGTDGTTYFESRSLAAADYFLYGSDDVAVVTLLNGLANNTITSASINDGAITDAKITTISVNSIQISGSTTAANNAEIMWDTDFATNYDAGNNYYKTNVQLVVGTTPIVIADVGDIVWDEATADHTSGNTFGGDALDNDVWTDAKAGFLTGDAYVRLGAPDGASIAADIAVIQALWDSLTITGGLLETDMKKLDGTAVKSTSGNIHALPGNI